MQKVELKKNWTLNQAAFNKFLTWLDGEADSGGQKYLDLRERLVAYFDRKNCLNADELADETINRAARRLEEEGKIESETPAKFCYIIAKFIFMEYLRSLEKVSVPIDEVSFKLKDTSDQEEKELKEKRLKCLEHCTEKLEAENRQLIINYYFGKEREKIDNRRSLAEKLGITLNALSIRACRIRDKLEACVRNCVEKD